VGLIYPATLWLEVRIIIALISARSLAVVGCRSLLRLYDDHTLSVQPRIQIAVSRPTPIRIRIPILWLRNHRPDVGSAAIEWIWIVDS
jgi:hypothetical protein